MPSIPSQPLSPTPNNLSTPAPPLSPIALSTTPQPEVDRFPLAESLKLDTQNEMMGKAQPNYHLNSLDIDLDIPVHMDLPKEGPQHFKPAQHSLDSMWGTTEFKLDTSEDDIKPNKPVALQTEHKINANVLELKSTHIESTTSFESNLKARLEGTESQAGVFSNEKPVDLQGKVGVKQKFGGQVMGIKYEADAFAQQDLTAKDFSTSGELTPVNMGAAASLAYTLGDANMQVKASTTDAGKKHTEATVDYKLGSVTNMQIKAVSASEGKTEALATFNYKQGIAKGSVFAGQEFNPTQSIDKIGGRFDMGNDTLQSYVSGEMRSSGQETLKTGLTMKFDNLKLGTEAGLSGTEQRFNQPHLRQTVGFEHKGFSFDASVDPLSFSSEPNYQVGLRFTKTF